MADELLARSVLAMDADMSGLEAGMVQAKSAVGDAERVIVQKAGRAMDALISVGDGAQAGAVKMDAAQRSIQRSLERQTAALRAGSSSGAAFAEELAKIRGINLDPLAKSLKDLRAAEDAAAAGAKNLGNAVVYADGAQRAARVSANQTRQAFQQLPAQITDVFTSLAGGQNPFLVLIQQGGQVRDAFGGIGNALRGVASLIKPVYVALSGVGAVLAAVAYGYKAGAEESDEFVRSIVLTGNAAGLTVGQLQGMSKAVAASGGTQGKAAEVLAMFAASAKVGAAELVKVSQAAIGLERVGGPAIEKTAAQFEALAKSPAKAAAELNAQTNFLTLAIYEQIKALEEQGRTSDAAAVAQSRFADVLNSRKVELEANLGSIERGWLAIKDAIKGAADALLGIGRATTAESQLSTARQALANREARGPLNQTPEVVASFEKGNAALRTQIELLSKASFREAERAGFVKLRNDAVQAGIALSQKQDQFLDNEAKKTREIAEIRRLARDSRLGDGAGISAEKEAALIDAVVKKYTEKKAKGEDLNKTYGALIASSAEHVAVMALEAAGADKLTQGEKRLLDMQSKIEAGTLTYNQALYAQAAAQFKAEDARERAIRSSEAAAKAERFYAEEREKSAQETTAFLVAEQAKRDSLAISIYEQSRALRDSNAALTMEASLVGRSASARNVALQQLRIRIQLERELEKIRSAGFDADARDQLIAKATANANKAIQDVATQENVNYIADLLDPTRAKTFGEALTDAFEGAGNALVKLTNTFEDYAAKRLALEERLASIKRDPGLDEATRQKGVTAVIEEQTKAQVDAYASMAGAAKGFFEENSKGYKALEAIETAFRLAQIAGAIESAATKIFSLQAITTATIVEETKRQAALEAFRAAELSSNAAHAAASMAQSQAIGQASAAPAIVKEGSISGLYGAIAMAALVAALGYATGAFGKSGGSSVATSAQRQGGAATGRVVGVNDSRAGTVFGDSDARSASIANGIDILADTARIELTFSRQQLSALESIRDSMAGLANLIVRSVGGGLTTGQNLNIQTGTLSANQGDPLARALGLGGLDKFIGSTSALFGAVGGALHGLWGKVKQEIVDSGLSILGNVSDVIVEQYVDFATTKSSFFGLVKKTTTGTQTGPVEDQIADQFGLIFRSIGDTLLATAGVLGRDGEAFSSALESFVIDLPRLSLKDLKGDELQEAIAAAIGGEADRLAASVLPGLADFQKVGEGYYETLIRVASGIDVANYQLELLGISAVEYTDIIRKQGDVGAEIVRQSIAAAETAGGVLSSVGAIVQTLSGTPDELAETYTALVDVRTVLVKVGEAGDSLTVAMIRGAGGLDNLASSLDTYFSEFFTEQEQFGANAQALGAEFQRLGLQMPTTRDGFRDLAESLNDGTDAGAALFAKVIGLAGAFDALADSQEERQKEIESTRVGLEIELLRAQGSGYAAVAIERQLEIDALRELDPALAAMQASIYAAADAAAVLSGLDSVIDDFLSGAELANYRASRIQQTLAGAGIDVSTDQIINATSEQIRWLFNNVGVDGQQAILDIYDAVIQLQEAARDDQIKTLIDGIADSADDLLAAYYEINPAADTLVQAWRDNTKEINLIYGALDKLAKVRTGSAIEQLIEDLESAVEKRDGLADVISSNRDTALDILVGRGTQEGVDALRKREAELWSEFSRTQDPAVAQAITKITLDRIRLEGTVAQKALQAQYEARYESELAAFELAQQTVTLEEQARETRKEQLREEIEAFERLKDAYQGMTEFVGGLRAGSLSNLSFTGRLEAQRGLFERSLVTGNDPQGQLTAYLQQAQQLFGGATKQYSDIFTSAIAMYEKAIRESAEKADPEIAFRQSQLNALEALVEKAPELQQAVVDTSQAEIDALASLDVSFGQGLKTLDTSITGLKTALEAKLTELTTQNATMTDRITQLGAEVIKLQTPAEQTAANTAAIANTIEDAVLRPS